jgi:glucosamine--fructose-6-phosphate aminotransferase (isomerizing)
MSPLDPRFPHYMLQEIYEQPNALQRGIDHYFSSEHRKTTEEEFRLSARDAESVRRIRIVASGSSRFAGLYGEYVLERLGGIPVEVDYSSQYAYRDPLTEPGELTVFLTQSGTTADTIAAQVEAKKKGAKTVVICNVKDAPITKDADGVIYTHAGKEVAVAATKSFTAQLLALFALSLYFGDLRGSLSKVRLAELISQLQSLPESVGTVLKNKGLCKQVASKYLAQLTWMILARDVSYPIALETALKFKETAYVFAEGFPTGEVKHGPTAIVDSSLPIWMVMTRDPQDAHSVLRYEKSLSILKDLRSKGSPIIAVANADDELVAGLSQDFIPVPTTDPLLSPMIEVIPSQLTAYFLAVGRGKDVDNPRNLSKSVVVE